MQIKFMVAFFALVLVVSCAKQESGIDLQNFDHSVRPQDDFYRYVNGKWLDTVEIPADKSNYGSFIALSDQSEKDLRTIIEEAARQLDKEPGSETQKVGDFYLSYMDTALIEELGLNPVRDEMQAIENLKSKNDVLEHFGHLQKIGVHIPFGFFVNQDLKQSEQYIGYITQSGLGLPDRDYYFKEDERFETIRAEYVKYMARILGLAGFKDAGAKAERLLEIETEIARSHWTRVQNRDRNRTYNKYDMVGLQKLTPSFTWSRFFEAADITNQEAVIVRQPDYLQEFNTIFKLVPTSDWKTYMTWKVLNGAAPMLPHDFVQARFEFYGKTLRGIEQIRPRWKRAVAAVDASLGEVVGKLYVARHFKPEARQRMQELVANLKRAFRERIERLDWMSEQTKQEAFAKLEKFNTKIGYPDKWKDYSGLEISKTDLLGNVKRSSLVEYERMVGKLGQPIDREEWFMTPQTVNAYYNPPMNEIVFPAAILQPPFFNLVADDAVNYGAIGAVIGHEISHGFDDQGRKSDGSGNLRDWWTEEDEREFNERAQLMVEQYNQYNPVDTMRVNGELTLGENIGDLGGLTVAFRAYQMSLDGKQPPVIDGFTGEQRFFLGWAQVWRRKYREDELRRRLLTDPHSPSEYRTNGIVANMPEFYEAFDVKEGDKLYRPDEKRVSIW